MQGGQAVRKNGLDFPGNVRKILNCYKGEEVCCQSLQKMAAGKGDGRLTRYRKKMKRKQAGLKMQGFFVLLLVIIGLCYAVYRYISAHREVLLIPIAVLAIGFCICLYRLLGKRRRRRKKILQTRTIQELIDRYNPYEFEYYIADLFKMYGFYVRVTRASNDGGIDIEMRKDGETFAVEVKQYSVDNKVGRDRIQKLDSAARHAEADHAIFVTTSSFTIPAIEYADELGIELIDGKALFAMIKRAKAAFSKQ